MYTLESALALPKTPRSQWMSVDAGGQIVANLFSNYREVLLTLSHPDLEDPIHVSMNQLRNDYSAYSNTLTVLLQVLGDYGFDTISSLPTETIKYISYSDLFQAQYHLYRTIIGQELPENYPLEEKIDLEITRDVITTNLSLLHTHALVTVNGFVHLTDTDGTRAYVVEGAKTCDKQNVNHAGVISFMDVGSLEKIPLRTIPLEAADEPNGLKEGIRFTLETDLTNKSVFLVLGGYLVFLQDNVFWKLSDQRFQLNLKNLPYIERLLESNRYLDMTSLGLSPSEASSTNLNMEEIWSDEVIRKYFDLTQTFMVVVDTPALYVRNVFMKQMLSPGIFTSYQKPTFPLMVGYGRLAEYWRRKDDGYWHVTATDTYLRQYVFNHQRKLMLENVHEQLTCYRPYFFSQGLLLEMSTYG